MMLNTSLGVLFTPWKQLFRQRVAVSRDSFTLEINMKLDGKIAVITGGNSGIGFATAKEFKANGARLVIFGRNLDTLNQASASLGTDVQTVQGDVRNFSILTVSLNKSE